MAARRLRNIELTELSLVDRPANPRAVVTLAKRDETEENVMKDEQPRPFATLAEAVEHLRKRHGIEVGKADNEAVAEFKLLVRDIMRRDDVPRSEAMRRAARQHPKKFEAYRAA